MRLLILFIILSVGCESYIYDDYKIVDFKKKNKEKNNRSKNKFYLVKKGDNLYSISRNFKTPIKDLIKVNNISEPYKIFPGQRISLPFNKTHKIKKGETLFSISRQYETNIYTLSKLNSIKNIDSVFVGQKLIIPRQIILIKKNKKKKIEKKYNKNTFSRKLEIKDSNNRFIWPVRGKLISKYGKTKDGFYNDGININSQKGVKVLSSEEGEVIYSGNEIPGYGNLILIKHSKNWITAYAHLNEVFIEKGKLVKKGDKIGSVGNTGNVRFPQLHFEIRKGKESVDPLRFL